MYLRHAALNTDYLEDKKFLNQYIAVLSQIGYKNLSPDVSAKLMSYLETGFNKDAFMKELFTTNSP
jgi:hypothetical protein